VDNECTLHLAIVLAICMPKIVTFGRDLTKFWQKQVQSFFGTPCSLLLCQKCNGFAWLCWRAAGLSWWCTSTESLFGFPHPEFQKRSILSQYEHLLLVICLFTCIDT